jgi:hypothetical protein
MRQTRSERWTEDVAVQASRLLVRKGVARGCRVESHDAEIESKVGDVRVDLPLKLVPGTFEAGLVAFSCSNSLVVEGNHRSA